MFRNFKELWDCFDLYVTMHMHELSETQVGIGEVYKKFIEETHERSRLIEEPEDEVVEFPADRFPEEGDWTANLA